MPTNGDFKTFEEIANTARKFGLSKSIFAPQILYLASDAGWYLDKLDWRNSPERSIQTRLFFYHHGKEHYERENPILDAQAIFLTQRILKRSSKDANLSIWMQRLQKRVRRDKKHLRV